MLMRDIVMRTSSYCGRFLLMTVLVALPGVLCAQELRARPTGDRQMPIAVQTTARVKGAAPLPEYPKALRAGRIEGEALLRFLVDSAGNVHPDSIRVVSASHPPFADAARAALLRRRYAPALQDGRPARQWIQECFEFLLPQTANERVRRPAGN